MQRFMNLVRFLKKINTVLSDFTSKLCPSGKAILSCFTLKLKKCHCHQKYHNVITICTQIMYNFVKTFGRLRGVKVTTCYMSHKFVKSKDTDMTLLTLSPMTIMIISTIHIKIRRITFYFISIAPNHIMHHLKAISEFTVKLLFFLGPCPMWTSVQYFLV